MRHKKRLKGAENRENNPVISLLRLLAVVPTERTQEDNKKLLQLF